MDFWQHRWNDSSQFDTACRNLKTNMSPSRRKKCGESSTRLCCCGLLEVVSGICQKSHQAILLKGSNLYYGGRKADGLVLLRQALDRNLAHPGNSYEGVFRGVAGEILKKEKMISLT